MRKSTLPLVFLFAAAVPLFAAQGQVTAELCNTYTTPDAHRICQAIGLAEERYAELDCTEAARVAVHADDQTACVRMATWNPVLANAELRALMIRVIVLERARKISAEDRENLIGLAKLGVERDEDRWMWCLSNDLTGRYDWQDDCIAVLNGHKPRRTSDARSPLRRGFGFWVTTARADDCHLDSRGNCRYPRLMWWGWVPDAVENLGMVSDVHHRWIGLPFRRAVWRAEDWR